MNKFVERNIRELKRLKGKQITDKTTQATKKRIDEIIKLYTERKLSNVATAENYIKGLTSTNKKVYDKTFQKYKDNISKIKETKPLKERMAETKKRKQKNTYFVQFDTFTIRKPKNEKIKPSFKHNGSSFYIDSFEIRSATIEAMEFPKDVIGQRIFKYESNEDEMEGKQNKTFIEILKLLSDDEDFDNLVSTLRQYYSDNLFDCIKIKSVELVNKNGKKFDILTENLTDAVNISIYHKYIHTPMSLEASTLKKAIQKGHYIKNLCWVNALMDFYGNSLMSEKTRKRLTTERIIDIIGKKQFDKYGASIRDMEKVFKEYNIQARIFDFCNKLIYKYDPENRNHHIKTFYAMVKNSHIYVLNHDLKSIQQKQSCNIPTVKASTDYYISKREEPPKYKMINNVNDILNIQVDENEKEINLVLENNDLLKALFYLLNSGYEPRIKFQAGIITEIQMKFNKIKYAIQTQNLLKTSCDGCIAVTDEKVYNNMNLAFFNFYSKVFNPIHKSFYNDIDIEILDEARTTVPLGLLVDMIDIQMLPESELMEIDISKAFTSAFLKMNEKPVFNQFDVWKHYDGKIKEHHDLTLYYIQNNNFQHNKMFMNKKYEIKYGCILKQVIDDVDIDILYFKTPSQVHQCNHQEIIDELWEMTISENDEENKYIKKLIANVNFGLLEKSGATDQKSILFRNLGEALDYQAEYGGKLHKISDIEMEGEETALPNEVGVETTMTPNNYYILNLKDQAKLKNGFRYEKELLLQIHNLEMFKAYKKLEENDIYVLSVKTDAFVIYDEEEVVEQILNFHNDIGGWRISKYKGDNMKISFVNFLKGCHNNLIKIPTFTHNVVDINDEYDTDNIIEVITEKKQMMIRGELPGTGKSYICQKMVDKNYRVMFVCPTNKLLQEFEGEALTINKFFGISFGDVKLEPFDYSSYDVVVFDEIYFSSLTTYWRIKQFVEEINIIKLLLLPVTQSN